jgi:hypothetical protein
MVASRVGPLAYPVGLLFYLGRCVNLIPPVKRTLNGYKQIFIRALAPQMCGVSGSDQGFRFADSVSVLAQGQ